MTVALRLAASLTAFSLLALSSIGCQQPVPVLYDGLDTIRYTRCVMKPDGNTIYASNYVDKIGGGYPPGSEVQVNMFSEIRVDLLINKIPHQLFPSVARFNAADIAGFLKRYFVESKAEIGIPEKKGAAAGGEPEVEDGATVGGPLNPLADGEGGAANNPEAWKLDKMKSATASSVKQGIAAVGMTKQEVFMALGPPAFINFDTPADPLGLDQIMESNRWVYYGSWGMKTFFFGLLGKRAYVFDGTNLTNVEQ